MAKITRILAANICRQFFFVINTAGSTRCLVENFQLKSGKKGLAPNRNFAMTLRPFIVQILFNYRRKGNAEQILNN